MQRYYILLKATGAGAVSYTHLTSLALFFCAFLGKARKKAGHGKAHDPR